MNSIDKKDVLRRDIEEYIARQRQGTVETHLSFYGKGEPVGVVVELVCPDRVRCAGCGEPVDRAGPVAIIDVFTGVETGGWDHQHGCGTWNTPISTTVDLDLTELGYGTDQELRQPFHAPGHVLYDRLDEALAALDETRWDAYVKSYDRILANLRVDLAEAVAAPESERDLYITGSEEEPGVWVDANGDLEAWDWDPRSIGAIVVVRVADLAVDRARKIVAMIDDEELARTVRYEMAERFGWTYCAYDRTDVEATLERPLTDTEWDLVRYSKDWRDVIPEQMAEGASISWMLDVLGITNDEDGLA